jgi:parallel beta-helix repeat protein
MTKGQFYTASSVSSLLILFLLMGSLTIVPSILAIGIQPGLQSTLYVDDDNINGPWDGTIQHPFSTIIEAIENAQKGDHIYIFKGIYHEHPILDKELSLDGENPREVIIDGNGMGQIITVTAPYSQINNITICDSGGQQHDAGIYITEKFIDISNCVFKRTKTGINVYSTDSIHISDCLFYQNGEGIYLNESKDILVEQCYFTHNGIGVNGFLSNNITLFNCNATINGIGVFLHDTSSAHLERCALFNNNDNQGGLFLEHCEDISLNNSHIYHNGFGVKTDACKDIIVDNSTFQFNTHFGMYIAEHTTEVQVRNCMFITNLRFSIRIENSDIEIHDSNLFGTLMGLYAINSTCLVQDNYWGSSFGPSSFEQPRRERIYEEESRIIWAPWLTTQKSPAGATGEINTNLPEMDVDFEPYITFEEPDSDSDGVPDFWEEIYGYDPLQKEDHKNLDPDQDGLTNIQECYAYEWGANPFKKDVFWEMDWMESQTNPDKSNKPSETLLAEIIDSFAAHNITLHVDTGELGGGEIIPYSFGFSYANLRDYYWDYFLHNDLNNPRKGIFHYGLICDEGPGPGFAFVGWDSLDGFCVSADMIVDRLPFFERDRFIVGGSVHELGHTLGLTVDDHGGNDNTVATMLFSKQWFLYLPYRSCMNYWYTYKIITFSDGTLGPTDFNDWAHMDLSFFKNTHFTLPEKYL